LVFALALGASEALRAQQSVAEAPQAKRSASIPSLPEHLPEKPSRAPVMTFPLEALGFSSPGSIYIGQRFSFVTLDFLDEDHLLLSFRVPGLMHREAGEYDERQIRALVVALPAGGVEAEALWTLHDRQRYLWMLGDGRFLLRDKENLELGDTSLELKPFLRFPGPLLSVAMDPEQKYLVTNSREPLAAHRPDEVSPPPGAEDGDSGSGQQPEIESGMTVRILRRNSGEVMLVSHAHSAVRLTINSEGYLEDLHTGSDQWQLRLNYFTGGSRTFAQIESTCAPAFDFLSRSELLVTTCTTTGTGELSAITTGGRRLWDALTSDATVWPLVVKAPGGLRMARETLAVTHPVTSSAPLSLEEIKGQLVEILDAADGKVELETAATPILDSGGNVAISPTGRRVAVLSGGAIQVFELPPPPPLPRQDVPAPGH
jgi:hypothetical protein